MKKRKIRQNVTIFPLISVFSIPEIDHCADGSHGCEQEFMNTENSCVCKCRKGYTLRPDGKTCKSKNLLLFHPCYSKDMVLDFLYTFWAWKQQHDTRWHVLWCIHSEELSNIVVYNFDCGRRDLISHWISLKTYFKCSYKIWRLQNWYLGLTFLYLWLDYFFILCGLW